MSWGWLKLLQIRDLVKPFFWSKLGNGKSTSIWYDRWCLQSPLINYLTPRDIYNAGYNLQNKVADLVTDNGWDWPQAWLLKAPDLNIIPIPQFYDNKEDSCQWRDNNGTTFIFLVKGVWESIQPRGTAVPWHDVVWFAHSIPRHSFHFWLVMRDSLKMQVKLHQRDIDIWAEPSTFLCPICQQQPDSTSHLFFECKFASDIWLNIRYLAQMEGIGPKLIDIMNYLIPIAHRRTTESIFRKVLTAAAAYFIWEERNNRLFRKTKRPPNDICDLIKFTARLKLMSFRFKNNEKMARLLDRWKRPKDFRIYGN